MFVNGDLKGKFIMDRNLGARDTKFASDCKGMLEYQYGRKDPIPGYTNYSLSTAAYKGRDNDAWSISCLAGPVAMSETINNPMAFITMASGSWCSSDAVMSESYVWHDYETDLATSGKSIFDPSPYGWKITPNGTCEGFSTATMTDYNDGSVDGQYGRSYPRGDNPFAYYPFHGARPSSDALNITYKTTTYFWTSTPASSITCYYMRFRTSEVSPTTTAGNRTSSLSIRCVGHDE